MIELRSLPLERGGKELLSSSSPDSPSILSRLATPPPANNSDMSHVIDDATSSMNDAIDDASTFLDDNVPLGEFLDEQLAGAKEIENAETDEITKTNEIIETGNFDSPIGNSAPRY